MKNLYFYLSLNGINIFNMLFSICTLVLLSHFYINNYYTEHLTLPVICLCILVFLKIFSLNIIFNFFEKFFPKSLLGQTAKELKKNLNERKFAMKLALVYDIILMLCLILITSKDFPSASATFITYEFTTLGGVYFCFIFHYFLYGKSKRIKKLIKNYVLLWNISIG